MWKPWIQSSSWLRYYRHLQPTGMNFLKDNNVYWNRVYRDFIHEYSVPSSKINGNFPEYEETNDLDDMKYVELSNTGIPSIGYKLNEDAFKMWRSIEEDIDKIKTMKCNED